jgi:outer membrane lipoprotein-sorting protein
MKMLRTCVSIPLVILFSIQVLGQQVKSHSTNQEELETILEKCAEYCEKLSHTVLFFVCKEKITERISSRHTTLPKGLERFRHTYTSTSKNVLVYDYQLYREGNDIKERRILIEENRKKKHEENAPLKTQAFEHENVVLGPIGLLSSHWQKFHYYRIIKEAKFKGEKTVIIEAELKPEYTFHHLSGKIWVRKSDYSILKIEWFQHSIRGYENVEERAKKLRAEPHLVLLAEYGYEKNGIRFPSKYSLDEVYIIKGRGRYRRSKTVVLYDDYKFFTVEMEHAIKKGEGVNQK